MISKHLRRHTPWLFTEISVHSFLLLNFPSIPDWNSHFMLFYALWYRHRGNVQPQSIVLVRKAKEENSGCEERCDNCVKKQADRNGEVDPEGEAQGSVSTQGLCQALLMLGLLLDFVGLRVSESSPGDIRCQSFRLSHFNYHGQASGGCKVQEQALHSYVCSMVSHVAASVALWGLYGASWGAARKHCADFPVAEKLLHQADTCLKESN